MCFGNTTTEQTQTSQSGTTSQNASSNQTGSANQNSATSGSTSATANPAVQAAAIGNLDFVQGLQNQGFQGYGGQQVAGLDPAQQATINAGQGIANNGTGAAATGLINSYAGAPAQNVSSNSIASNMSPYMNQYVMQALAPQLAQMDQANAATNQATNAQATGSGAFGDARAGIADSNNRFNQGVQREGVIGNAYNAAFNTAIGAGAQDSANQLSAANSNAGYSEAALGRALGGANALQGLQSQQMGTQTAANALAGQNTANNQADLTAQYNQWLMAQQYPFQTAQLMNQTVAGGANAMPASTQTQGSTVGSSNTSASGTSSATGTSTSNGTSTTQKPDNSGLALLGSLGGTLLGGPIGGAIGGGLGSMFGGGGGGITLGGAGGPMPFF
jgi:hypothetical protein